jgi:hypothetical protein
LSGKTPSGIQIAVVAIRTEIGADSCRGENFRAGEMDCRFGLIIRVFGGRDLRQVEPNNG